MKAFYVFFIVVMIASMAAVGLGVGASSDPEPPPLIDATVAPSVTPANKVFEGPAKVIDGTQPHVATLETNKGTIEIELMTDAPQAVNNLAFLAAKGFYDGTALYYVDHTYVAQGGDPNCKPDSEQICTGFGDPGYVLPLEESATKHEQWVVAMPSVSEADSVHGSQFRIYFQRDDRLDGEETVFGKVTEGQEILEELPDLKICTALTQQTDDCEDGFENALIIEDVSVAAAAS